MAGAGGTSPKKQPDIDSIREALIPEILKALQAPQPTPPQYQPTPISPQQGYAIARNPQAAGLINQTIQAPGQAQFQQQQAAFEQAMSGRQDAMRGAIALTGQQSQEREAAARAAATAGRPESIAFLPTPQGYFPVGRRSGEVGNVLESPGGSTLYPNPPAGVVQGVAAESATLGGLQDLRNAYTDIRSKTKGQSFVGQVGRQYLGETRFGGKLAPDYAKYTADRRAALNAYIKGQTGAQFSVKELERYEAQYPEPWDPEDVADKKIQALEARALNDMRAKLKAYPAAGQIPSTAPYSGVTLHESDFANAKPGERERFIAGGGKVVP